MVAASVIRRPAANSDWMLSRLSMVAICGPPPCTTTGLIAVCSSSTMSRANAFAVSSAPMAWPPYLMTMVSSSYCCICGSASDRMRAWSSGLMSVMERVSVAGGRVGRFLSDCRGERKALLIPPRPDRREREQQPAHDQQRAAGRRGEGKQAVAGILPQGEIAREQDARDDEAEAGGESQPCVDQAALGEHDTGENCSGMKQQHGGGGG